MEELFWGHGGVISAAGRMSPDPLFYCEPLTTVLVEKSAQPLNLSELKRCP